MKHLALGCFFLFLAGCAAGNQYDYRSSEIYLPLKSAKHRDVVLTVREVRPYVLQGKKSSNFVGLQRGGFGNPFDVTTASGNSLTEDMVIAISRALKESGYQVYAIKGDAATGVLVETAASNGASRIIALDVKEWKSDIYMSITLHSDLELRVYDGEGEMLAQSDMKFVEEIGGAQIGAGKNSELVAREFSKRIGYLFNRNEIREALQ